MKKITFFALFVALLLATSKPEALAAGYWMVQGSTATETQTFQNGKGPVSFVISYNRNNSCRPEVSLIIWSDNSRVLGNLIKRKSTKDNMVITIDGKSFYSTLTGTKYSNALDVGFVMNEQSVGQFKNGKNAVVKAYSYQFEFPLDGARSAIDEARRNCM
ncbi:MAG: hypothetical protein PHH91_08870 [Desulfuromonadaceae bacterium]|nr:hypothetical protein [Desulfuromonadaceae bacterium]